MMVGLILAAMVASTDPTVQSVAPASGPKMCSVPCRPKAKPQPKKVTPPAPAVVVKEQACCAPPTQGQEQKQDQRQQVIVNVTMPAPAPAPKVEDPFPAGLGVRAALGLHTCAPFAFAQVGLRARFPSVRLGLDLNHQFAYGTGISALVYPVQGPLAWHLDVGAVTMFSTPLSSAQIPRKVDMSLGTGLELQVVKNLSLTADWRWTFPEPGILAHPRVNVRNTLGNSLHRSQLMLGVMVHTW